MAKWQDAIRSIAIELLDGENIRPRAAHLAACYGVDIHTTLISIEEAAQLLAD